MGRLKGVTWLLLLFAFVAGVALPVQFSINAVLRGFVGGPAVAATISFFGGTPVLLGGRGSGDFLGQCTCSLPS
jgi:hypothetical protein